MLSDSAIEKKRRLAQERAERLKDPKQRALGMDREALDEQIREKELRKQQEKDRNAFFDRQALLMDKHACTLQHEVDSLRIQREKEINDFRSTFQKREAGRDFDLVDPKRVTGDIPARVHDEDPRNGVSSLQRFEGEDLDAANRRKAQQDQVRAWAQQQTDEKLAKKWMEQEANKAFEDRLEETNFRTYQIEQTIAAQRRQRDINQAEFNKAMAEQKRREALRDRNVRTQQNLEEIHNMLDSDFLNEQEGTVTALGEKVKSERFRGFTDDQRAAILAAQEKQREELRLRRLQEAEDERQWAHQEQNMLRMAGALDRQRERERNDARRQLAEERANQAGEARARKDHMNKVFENAVGENYYKHWGNCL